MGATGPFEGARLVLALLSGPDFGLDDPAHPLRAELEALFGPADFLESGLPFSWTDYYAQELGDTQLRSFLSFPRHVDPATLASLKLATNALEARYSSAGRRRVNIDPGLLSLGNFVLATTKGRAHRIALADGIYAELTLIYRDAAYRPLPWTYPDWRSPAYGDYLLGVRAALKRELRSRARSAVAPLRGGGSSNHAGGSFNRAGGGAA